MSEMTHCANCAAGVPVDKPHRVGECRQPTATLTLTDFLLARIAEDEAVARGLDWLPRWVMARDMPNALPGVVEHIMRFDPIRVLAECETKRRIVEEAAKTARNDHSTWLTGVPSADPEYAGGVESALEFVVKALALPYADHEDWREDWRV